MDKMTVKMWDKSWFNLLYAMEMNLPLLNDSQYYTSFQEYPLGSGQYRLTRKRANINTRAILRQIAKQTGMTQAIKDAARLHSQIKEIEESGRDTHSKEQMIDALKIT